MSKEKHLQTLESQHWWLIHYPRAQLSSPSIWTLAILSGLLHWLSGLGFKNGTFWDVVRLWEPTLGVLVGWQLVSEGSGLPSLSSPTLHLNSLFWWPYQDPLDNPSTDGQDCHTQSNSSFSFGIAQLHWQTGWCSWSAPPISLGFLGLPLTIQPLLPPLTLQSSLPQFQWFPLQQIKTWRCDCPSAS